MRWLLVAIMMYLPVGVAADEIKILVISTDFVTPAKFDHIGKVAETEGITVSHLTTQASAEELGEALHDSTLVILDGPRPSDMQAIQVALPDKAEGLASPWLQIGGGAPAFGNMSAENARILIGYYAHGGAANYQHFFAAFGEWLSSGVITDAPAPERLPVAGIYTPDGVHASLDEYLASADDLVNRPLLGFMISENHIRNLQTMLIDDIYQHAYNAGFAPVLFWFEQSDPHALTNFWQGHQPAAVVNLTHLQQGDARKAEFLELDVPVLQGLTYRDGDLNAWQMDPQGVSGGAFATLLSVPESWGITDPLVIAAMGDGEPELIPSQFSLLTDKVHSLRRLQQAANEDKSLALMFWNSPAGEENFSASNLNVPASLAHLTVALNEAGYGVDVHDEESVIATGKQLLGGLYHPERLENLAQQGLTTSVSLTTYQAWFESLPQGIQDEVNVRWGPPGEHTNLREFAGKSAFLFPAVRWGNLLVMPQPPRSGVVGAGVHDSKTPPDHYYLAAYLALCEAQTDALIHFGTHGTQEWLPGKARGLSADDYSMLVLGAMPVFYPYIQDNISEAMQARRRGRATVISHQTPPFAPSGLYDELRTLHELIHEYGQLTDGQVRNQVVENLLSQAGELNLFDDLGITRQQAAADFPVFYEKVHDYLHFLAESVVPLGLHTFGQAADTDHLLLTVLQQLGMPYYTLLSDEPEELMTRDLADIKQSKAMQLLEKVLLNEGTLPEEPELRALLQQAERNYQHLTAPGETEALLHVLQGGFIAAGLGGDPVRNPEATSGTNLYAFDPLKVPTEAAYRAGEEALQDLLDDYHQTHGQYPGKLAFSLWSGETQRHMGIVEAQVLHALGLSPEWDRAGRLADLVIIPESELQRPRIDVVLQVTSVYRDQFDGFMRNLSDAIERLAVLDNGNPIAINSRNLAIQLQAEGLDEARARQLARLRIFGNAPGDYGSGVPDIALDSTSWDDDTVVAEQFLQRLQYAYGSDVWGVAIEQSNLFAEQLKGVDAAVMSRSSNLHGLLSTDHPFEFLGGLASAIRHVSGRDADLYISDLRQPTARMVNADRFISEELRSRYLNPSWLGSMQAEGYAGALEMLDIVNNMFGWQVMAPEVIRDDQWDAMHDVLIGDKHNLDLNEWFEQHQPAAQIQIIERMTEAIRKEYWDADDAIRQSLAERYQTLQEIHPDYQGNAITQAFLEDMGRGFGLDTGVGEAGAAAQPVSGQQMQRTETPSEPTTAVFIEWLVWLILILCIVVGAVHQARQQRK